jgi:hypothetical protein
MRVPLPDKIRLKYAVLFAVALALAQAFEQTNLSYIALSAIYVLAFAAAFNAAGGLVYPSGNWIFFNGFLGVLFGIVFKAILGEPGHTNQQDPTGTMLVECCAMAMFGVVAALNRRLVPKKPFVSLHLEGESMKKAAIGCCIVGAFLLVYTWPKPNDDGTLASALRQVNHFPEMAVLLGTFYEVRKSGSRKSSNWIVWVSCFLLFATGLLTFGKQAILAGPFSWLLAAVIAGHNFTRKQIVMVILSFLFFQQYLVPYAQEGRALRSDDHNVSADAAGAWQYLTTLSQTRIQYASDQLESVEKKGSDEQLYNQPEGFFERLSMLKPDDDLISFTNRGNVEGMLPTAWAITNVIPHFLYKDKHVVNFGNMYTHEMGGLGDDDDSTGISYTPEADAYHQATWFGIFVLLPTLLLGLFYLMDSVSGDVRTAPWGVLYIVTVAHMAPEGLIPGIFYTATFLTETILVVALFSKYVLPIFAGIITNSERTRVRKTRDFQPIAIGRGPLPLVSAATSSKID